MDLRRAPEKYNHGDCGTEVIEAKSYWQYKSSLNAERVDSSRLCSSRLTGSPDRNITDHLNSVRDTKRMRGVPYLDDTWRPQPGHELYRWLADTLDGINTPVHHVKAHIEAEDSDSPLNAMADNEAPGVF